MPLLKFRITWTFELTYLRKKVYADISGDSTGIKGAAGELQVAVGSVYLSFYLSIYPSIKRGVYMDRTNLAPLPSIKKGVFMEEWAKHEACRQPYGDKICRFDTAGRARAI